MIGSNYLSMLGLKLIHVSKRGPSCLLNHCFISYGVVITGARGTTGKIVGLGPISLFFTSQFKFDGNFVSFSPRFQYSDHNKILYLARQLCYRGMCKNLLWSDGQQGIYSKAKFPLNLNYEQKIVSETGPWARSPSAPPNFLNFGAALAWLFHTPHTVCGGGLHSGSASCW